MSAFWRRNFINPGAGQSLFAQLRSGCRQSSRAIDFTVSETLQSFARMPDATTTDRYLATADIAGGRVGGRGFTSHWASQASPEPDACC